MRICTALAVMESIKSSAATIPTTRRCTKNTSFPLFSLKRKRKEEAFLVQMFLKNI